MSLIDSAINPWWSNQVGQSSGAMLGQQAAVEAAMGAAHQQAHPNLAAMQQMSHDACMHQIGQNLRRGIDITSEVNQKIIRADMANGEPKEPEKKKSLDDVVFKPGLGVFGENFK
jgi:hypothetical protein